MRVIEFSRDNSNKLEEFIKTITDGSTRPAVYIGIDKEGEPVLYTGEGLSWKEISYIKTAFEMYVIKEWNG